MAACSAARGGGAGYGGGLDFDPQRTSPGYRPGECRSGPLIEAGGYADGGGNFGALSAGYGASGGVRFPIFGDSIGDARGYYNGPAPYSSVSDGKGLGLGGGIGAQVTFVW